MFADFLSKSMGEKMDMSLIPLSLSPNDLTKMLNLKSQCVMLTKGIKVNRSNLVLVSEAFEESDNYQWQSYSWS